MKRVIFLLLLIPLFFACGGGETPAESSSKKKDPSVAVCNHGEKTVDTDGHTILACKDDGSGWEVFLPCPDNLNMVPNESRDGCVCKSEFVEKNGQCVCPEGKSYDASSKTCLDLP